MGGTCLGCHGKAPGSHNYCSWQCQIDLATRNGGKVINPNGLPIRSIRWDNTMLEHEHADHPAYKFPVKIEYIGQISDDDREEYMMMAGNEIVPDDEAVRKSESQTHALIYTDRSIALTMWEYCYAMWSLRDGEFIGGSLWKSKDYQLSEESREEIRRRCLNVTE